jgi:hypothetical protein
VYQEKLMMETEIVTGTMCRLYGPRVIVAVLGAAFVVDDPNTKMALQKLLC